MPWECLWRIPPHLRKWHGHLGGCSGPQPWSHPWCSLSLTPHIQSFRQSHFQYLQNIRRIRSLPFFLLVICEKNCNIDKIHKTYSSVALSTSVNNPCGSGIPKLRSFCLVSTQDKTEFGKESQTLFLGQEMEDNQMPNDSFSGELGRY